MVRVGGTPEGLVIPHPNLCMCSVCLRNSSAQWPTGAVLNTVRYHKQRCCCFCDFLLSVPHINPSAGFPRTGRVRVRIQFTREEHPDFPPFHLPVLSPEEAICDTLRADSESESSVPLLASLLSFLAHSGSSGGSRGGGEGRSLATGGVDGVLCDLLYSVNPAELPDWRLGPLLSGKPF